MPTRLVRDTTSGTVLADRAQLADSWWTRFKGLMLRKELPAGEGLIIQPCGSIHMMFMRIRIDAVFFSRGGEVVRVSRNLRRWTGFAMGGHRVYGVIELPAGAAAGVERGHGLEFEDVEESEPVSSEA